MSALDIYLPLFSVTVTSDLATIYGEQFASLNGDATADVDISTTLMQSLFQFQTDSTDINDISVNDIKYKVVYTSASPILPLGIDIDVSSNVSFGAISNTGGLNQNVTYDYLRHLAFKLFGTHLGVDLFNNEEAVRSALNLSFKTALDTMLSTDNGVERHSGEDTYMRASLLQIIKFAPERLADITTYEVGVDGTSGETWYKTPFLAGDKIYFNLTVNPHADQDTATTGATVTPRVYLIRGTLV
jgi:hypothetical protein